MLLYSGRHAKSEKVGCWCWVSSRSGWLLELLTELKIAIYCPQGSGTLRQQYARVCQSMPEYARVCQSMPEYARVCKSMPEYARVCKSMPEYARVCQICRSMPEYARV